MTVPVSSTKPVETQTAFSGVRPPRIATLILLSTPNWETACQDIIQFYSQCWGGAFNLIIPTDGNTIDPAFCDILDAFDADYIYCYGRHDTFNISYQLAREIQTRFAPMMDGDDVTQSARVLPGRSPSWPLTSLSSFIARHARRIVTLSVHSPSIPKLWYQANTGDIGTQYSERLGDDGMTHDVIRVAEENTTSLIYFVLSASERRTTEAVLDHAIQSLGVQPIDLWSVQDILPFAHSMHGLSFYTPAPLLRRQPKAIIAGRTLADFCLYYALSRLLGHVAWWLPEWQSDPTVRESFVRAFNTTTHQDETVVLGSSMETLPDIGVSTQVSLAPRDLIGKGRFPFDGTLGLRPMTMQFLEGNLLGFLDTPRPKALGELDPFEHRWMTEISIPEHWLPRNTALASKVIEGTASMFGQTRVGKRGVIYFCPNVAVFNSDIESVLVRPAVRLPTCLEVVDIIGECLGYRCRLSDKGFYSRELVEKLGGLPDAARFFRNNVNRNAMLKFLDTNRPGEGVYDQGVFLSDRRRYLNFESLKVIMGTRERARDFIDFCVSCDLILRGYIFKCQFCRHSAWYAVGKTTEQFTCARCGRSQVYTYRNWRYPDEPSWFYKLDEIVYQGLINDCYLTLLTLDFLRQRGPRGFLYTFEVDLRQAADDSPYCEIDVCAVVNGDLVIGEVKKGDKLERQRLPEEQCISRYHELAEGLGVRLAVFATAETAWSERTSEAINSVFRDSVVPVQQLTHSDLFAEPRSR